MNLRSGDRSHILRSFCSAGGCIKQSAASRNVNNSFSQQHMAESISWYSNPFSDSKTVSTPSKRRKEYCRKKDEFRLYDTPEPRSYRQLFVSKKDHHRHGGMLPICTYRCKAKDHGLKRATRAITKTKTPSNKSNNPFSSTTISGNETFDEDHLNDVSAQTKNKVDTSKRFTYLKQARKVLYFQETYEFYENQPSLLDWGNVKSNEDVSNETRFVENRRCGISQNGRITGKATGRSMREGVDDDERLKNIDNDNVTTLITNRPFPVMIITSAIIIFLTTLWLTWSSSSLLIASFVSAYCSNFSPLSQVVATASFVSWDGLSITAIFDYQMITVAVQYIFQILLSTISQNFQYFSMPDTNLVLDRLKKEGNHLQFGRESFQNRKSDGQECSQITKHFDDAYMKIIANINDITINEYFDDISRLASGNEISDDFVESITKGVQFDFIGPTNHNIPKYFTHHADEIMTLTKNATYIVAKIMNRIENLEDALTKLSDIMMDRIGELSNQMKLIESRCFRAGHRSTEVEMSSEEEVDLIVIERVRPYFDDSMTLESDETFNFALEISGGSVISTLCTAFHSKPTEESLYGGTTSSSSSTFISLEEVYNKYLKHTFTMNARNIVQTSSYTIVSSWPSNFNVDDCWCFEGAVGRIIIKLAYSMTPTHFSIDHIRHPLITAGDKLFKSSPKNFTVYGFSDDYEGKSISTYIDNRSHLGSFIYEQNTHRKKSRQFFHMSPSKLFSKSISFVELEVNSNYGNMDFTCVYRFGVYGNIADHR